DRAARPGPDPVPGHRRGTAAPRVPRAPAPPLPVALRAAEGRRPPAPRRGGGAGPVRLRGAGGAGVAAPPAAADLAAEAEPRPVPGADRAGVGRPAGPDAPVRGCRAVKPRGREIPRVRSTGRLRILRRLFHIAPLLVDLILFQLQPERFAVNPQQRRRLRVVAAGAGERLADGPLLQLFQVEGGQPLA